MGTSISQSSPTTTNWAAVGAAYDNDAVPVERLVQELWRAAQGVDAADWRALLAEPVIAACKDIAIQSETPASAGAGAAREIVRRRASSLAATIAQRAVVQSFAAADRAQGFAQSLFVGVSDYLVSRDLSGRVGATERTRTIADLMHFKAAIRERVAEVVRRAGVPPQLGADEDWRTFVATTIEQLAG